MLEYHKSGCQCVVFGNPHRADEGGEDEDDDISETQKKKRERWLVAGAKDNRVSIWSLISFDRSELPN